MKDLKLTPDNPTACVILLHGCNEQAKDYSATVEQMATALPHVKWVVPQSEPRHVDMLNATVPAWFNVSNEEDAPGLKRASAYIDALIEEAIASGIPKARVVVGGFSMGAAAALYHLFSRGSGAAYFSLSGWVPLQKLARKVEAKPLFFAYGEEDDIIDEEELGQSLECLERCGLKERMEYKRYPGLGHERSEEETRDLVAWIGEVLK